MIKKFYKSKAAVKTFFSSDIKVRSYAYGKDVHDEFVKWEEYFFSKWRNAHGSFWLSSQGNIMGGDYVQSSAAHPRAADGKLMLPTLKLDGMEYEALIDGRVTVNGKISSLNIGAEVKAWALADIPRGTELLCALLVIGKPRGDNRMMLSCYELSAHGPTGRMLDMVEYENCLDASSSLIALGKHIFTIHNAKLDYHYFNTDTDSLEEVSLGDDKCNSELDWCQCVGKNVFATADGKVFWTSDGGIYGFSVGYPKRLIVIRFSVAEVLLGLRTDTSGVTAFVKDKNTGQKKTYRCIEKNGKYELIPVAGK